MGKNEAMGCLNESILLREPPNTVNFKKVFFIPMWPSLELGCMILSCYSNVTYKAWNDRYQTSCALFSDKFEFLSLGTPPPTT